MKKAEVEFRGVYVAKVSGRLVTARIGGKSPGAKSGTSVRGAVMTTTTSCAGIDWLEPSGEIADAEIEALIAQWRERLAPWAEMPVPNMDGEPCHETTVAVP